MTESSNAPYELLPIEMAEQELECLKREMFTCLELPNSKELTLRMDSIYRKLVEKTGKFGTAYKCFSESLIFEEVLYKETGKERYMMMGHVAQGKNHYYAIFKLNKSLLAELCPTDQDKLDIQEARHEILMKE